MENSLLKWFDIHFAQSSFNGRMQIGYRKKQSTALIPLSTHDRADLREFLEQMFIRTDYDYYVMANAISGVKRNLESLFSYHNIVIDVDNHDDKVSDWNGSYFSEEEFISRFFRDKPAQMPNPTSIVHTGRGLQFWWAIKPVHKSCKTYFDEVRIRFIDIFEELIAEYSDLQEFSVDYGASCNDVGYFRLPTSWNTKVHKQAVVEINPEKPIYILQDLVSFVKEMKVKETFHGLVERHVQDQTFKQNFADHEVFILKNVQTLAFFRIRQLILLRKIRDFSVSNETRNNLNFMMYNTLLPAMGEMEAWERLCIFNEGFKQPMSKDELEGVIVSAKQKGGYKYSNEKIILFLNINPDEQEKIGLFKVNKQEMGVRFSRNPSRNASRALVKENRNQKVFELWKSGVKIGKIAEQTGLSPPTVSKILKVSDKKEEQKKAALNLLSKGVAVSEVAEQVDLSISTIKRIKVAHLQRFSSK